MGLIELLVLLFAAAKVFGFIAWSWAWVFSPMWIGYPTLFVVFCTIASIWGTEALKGFRK